MTQMDLPEVVFRPLTLDDFSAVQALTANTWGDSSEDYVAEVFAEWVNDPDCLFICLEVAGEVAGITNIRNLGNREFWLEGLRVDPNRRGQGLGWRLHQHNIELARQQGARVLRYATGSENLISQGFALRSGFVSEGLHRRYGASCAAAPVEGRTALPVPLTPADFPDIEPLLAGRALAGKLGLYQYDWHWQALTPARVQWHLERGEVFGMRTAERLAAWAIAGPTDEVFEVYHLDGGTEAQQALLVGLKPLAALLPRAELRIRVPDGTEQAGWLAAWGAEHGFVPAEHALWVYALYFKGGGSE